MQANLSRAQPYFAFEQRRATLCHEMMREPQNHGYHFTCFQNYVTHIRKLVCIDPLNPKSD